MITVKIARHKSGRTHFAAAVAPAGNVTAWSERPEDAVAVREELALAAVAYYSGPRGAGAGKIVFADAETGRPFRAPVECPEKKPTAPALLRPVPEKEGEFQKQAKVLGEQLEACERDNDALTAEVARLKAVSAGAEAEIERLRAKVAELDAIIASAK